MDHFNWKTILLGNEDWSILPETAFRTLIMFLVILTSLRLLGKRGVKQLSVFELGVIIGLGSAAGDPMFYKDVGLLAGMVVFVVVFSLYKLVTYLINRSDSFEQFVEGKPTCILQDGQMIILNFDSEPIALDEFFSQLRLNGISHLGQVQQSIIEPNGEISIFYYKDEEVKPGLPILPQLYNNKSIKIEKPGLYACAHCGFVKELPEIVKASCPQCNRAYWVPTLKFSRIR